MIKFKLALDSWRAIVTCVSMIHRGPLLRHIFFGPFPFYRKIIQKKKRHQIFADRLFWGKYARKKCSNFKFLLYRILYSSYYSSARVNNVNPLRVLLSIAVSGMYLLWGGIRLFQLYNICKKEISLHYRDLYKLVLFIYK